MKSSTILSFEDLDCWKACRRLRVFVHQTVIPILPREERFNLIDQLRRASRRTTANIAEGFGRYHFLDNRKFCGISRGSCFEVIDHLITASDEGLIGVDLLQHGRQLAQEAVRLLNGYMAYLKRAEQDRS